jgi:nucleotide-binding universal stress UspA family protein
VHGRVEALIPDAQTVIREASPRPVIVDAALELNCQMIVMGTHGRSGLAHLLLGSVAEYVVRNSKVPVLSVRMHQT